MGVMRKALLAVSAAVVAVAAIGAANAGPEAAPEADVAHHGHVSLTGGRLKVSLASESLGPANLENATVRLAFSAPPAAVPALPPGCLWSTETVVLCATGPLRAGAGGRRVALDLRTRGTPEQVAVEIGTHWNGGVADESPDNNEHRVLTPATGRSYAF
ncbi:hypothetical protein [Streptomyces jumonjinensis]|uniref:DUF11 domain-containing protein n=1 Tax=Streptomyces jumonjinensis TaxID=1945 RepID=A0A646KLP7_STRJU|nr:hypothetical protein [Streptomyces jumonjinensis]MQT02957.1 hypothetical protein [Streptomyces jumonjinensis]